MTLTDAARKGIPWVAEDRFRSHEEREALAACLKLEGLERAVRALQAEGWFAPWSDDPRVLAIREALS